MREWGVPWPGVGGPRCSKVGLVDWLMYDFGSHSLSVRGLPPEKAVFKQLKVTTKGIFPYSPKLPWYFILIFHYFRICSQVLGLLKFSRMILIYFHSLCICSECREDSGLPNYHWTSQVISCSLIFFFTMLVGNNNFWSLLQWIIT